MKQAYVVAFKAPTPPTTAAFVFRATDWLSVSNYLSDIDARLVPYPGCDGCTVRTEITLLFTLYFITMPSLTTGKVATSLASEQFLSNRPSNLFDEVCDMGCDGLAYPRAAALSAMHGTGYHVLQRAFDRAKHTYNHINNMQDSLSSKWHCCEKTQHCTSCLPVRHSWHHA